MGESEGRRHALPNPGRGRDCVLRKLCPGIHRTLKRELGRNWAEISNSLHLLQHSGSLTLNTKKGLHIGPEATVRGSVGLSLSLSFLWILASEGVRQFPVVRKTLLHSTKVYRGAGEGCEDCSNRRSSLICSALCP